MEGPATLLELGAVVLVLAILARTAGRIGVTAAPFYLLAGLAVGEGGLWPLVTTRGFVHFGADVGLILLLFMLGLEYSARELIDGVRRSPWAGAIDLGLNAPVGVAAGLLLGWGLEASVLLGGVVAVTSSGTVATMLRDVARARAPEAPIVLSLLLVEDLGVAVYLPVVSAMLAGVAGLAGLVSPAIAIVAVAAMLLAALHLEIGVSKILFSRSDEALLLSILGFTLLVAGTAELLHVSAAVGALLGGIVLSGPAAHGARHLLAPLRDLFAAVFFFFIGLTVDPSTLPALLPQAAAIAVVAAATKFATGWFAARHAGLDLGAQARAGALVIPRGEFSLAIAGIGAAAGIDHPIVPLTVATVLILFAIAVIALRIAPDPPEPREDDPSSTPHRDRVPS
jgi:CPA2 family monovalent cation:H+ antiporter-2